jgi:hypothetical protein
MPLPPQLFVKSLKLPEKSKPPKIAVAIGKNNNNKCRGIILVLSIQILHFY